MAAAVPGDQIVLTASFPVTGTITLGGEIALDGQGFGLTVPGDDDLFVVNSLGTSTFTEVDVVPSAPTTSRKLTSSNAEQSLFWPV